MRKKLSVVAALIIKDGRVFATQRGDGVFCGYWEFPGGKIETGETPQEALKREIREELDTDICIGPLWDTLHYAYPDFDLEMGCYLCSLTLPPTLKEHKAARWLAYDQLREVTWLPANYNLLEALEAHLKQA